MPLSSAYGPIWAESITPGGQGLVPKGVVEAIGAVVGACSSDSAM